MNDDSIATHMYWHVLSVLLTGQKKKKKKKKEEDHPSHLNVITDSSYRLIYLTCSIVAMWNNTITYLDVMLKE